jgi:Tfp pilus assembly protein FimT
MRRDGHSLPELTVVAALAALIAALGVPSMLHVSDRARVEAAARQLVHAHREARLLATTSRRTALLRLSADSIELRLTRGGPDTTLVWQHPGPRQFDVTVIGNARTMRFIPTGYTIGVSNASYTLSRGAAKRRVVISRLGRVRVE